MIIKAFRKNAETFYNFQTGKKVSVAPRYAALIVVSIVASFVVEPNLSGFANLSVAILAIFVGFSFAILFMIVSSKDQAQRVALGSNEDLEAVIESARVTRLEDELFCNLSYFNLISLVSSAVLLLHSISIVSFLHDTFGVKVANYYQTFGIRFGVFLAILLVTEALLTFYRVTRRMTNYFERKTGTSGR